MKNLFILLFLTFCVHINAQIINFPDTNFKSTLVDTFCIDTNSDGFYDMDADPNNDGEVDLSEALQVNNLGLGFRSISSLNGIENFKNLEKLVCYENNLKTLDLRELKNLRLLNCYGNELTTIDVRGLKKLTEFGCDQNQLTNLDVGDLTSLEYLYCDYNQLNFLNVDSLKNLKYVTCSHNNLKSLHLNSANKLSILYCNNNELISLFIKTGSYVNEHGFWSNPDLAYICCNESQIAEIIEQTQAYSLSKCQVNTYCSFTPGGKFYTITGKHAYDINSNGCDALDINIPSLKFNINNGVTTGSFISNGIGSFSFFLQAGTHTITPILEYPAHFEITPSSYTVAFPNTSDTITQNFCFTPKSTIFRQTNITVIPLTPPARPGFNASYKIVWENVGNQIESGTLNFTYDETLLDYISATQSPNQIADGIVKWNFINLLPFEKREITVTIKVNRPTDTPAVNAGDKLYLTASILDNIFTLENTVVGSYDPNDKTCLQGDRVKPDMVGEYVDYLIRFENTGNYAAENVVVKDIIDTKTFDVSTLQITDASHEVYTRIEGNKVEFIFENIQLPFNDANNDGYIAFKIKTLPTLVIGDSLKNLADIYFDYNFPIRTNEAKTTIALSVPTADITTDISIYPNPVRDILHLQTDEIWTKSEIYDITGRIMRSVSLDSKSIDVDSLESGTYIIKLRNGDKSGNVKFVKM